MVVFGHTYNLGDLDFDTFGEKLFASLVTGATTIFVFISGFLFYEVFYKRYDYAAFIKTKAKNLLIPYAILTTPPIILALIYHQYFSEFYKPDGTGFFQEYLVPYVKYFVTGRALTAYWYIPFICLMFVCAPLHVAFIRLNNRAQISTIIIAYAISALIHRPIGNMNTIHSLIYSVGPYLLGIWCAINKDGLYRRLTGLEWTLLIPALLIASLQASLGHYESYQKPMFSWGGIDLMLLQKALFSLFFMIFLHRFENVRIHWLERISQVSFAIFFIHPWFLQLFNRIEDRWSPAGESWLLYLLITMVILYSCVTIALTFKKFLGKRSRYLIGY